MDAVEKLFVIDPGLLNWGRVSAKLPITCRDFPRYAPYVHWRRLSKNPSMKTLFPSLYLSMIRDNMIQNIDWNLASRVCAFTDEDVDRFGKFINWTLFLTKNASAWMCHTPLLSENTLRAVLRNGLSPAEFRSLAKRDPGVLRVLPYCGTKQLMSFVNCLSQNQLSSLDWVRLTKTVVRFKLMTPVTLECQRHRWHWPVLNRSRYIVETFFAHRTHWHEWKINVSIGNWAFCYLLDHHAVWNLRRVPCNTRAWVEIIFFRLYDNPTLNWSRIFRTMVVDVDVITKSRVRVIGRALSQNKNLRPEHVSALDSVDWDWVCISQNVFLTVEFIRQFNGKLSFWEMSSNPSLSIEIINAFPNEDWRKDVVSKFSRVLNDTPR